MSRRAASAGVAFVISEPDPVGQRLVMSRFNDADDRDRRGHDDE
ncbi:hypothetical protein [Microvirga makkahensis]|nr:hypothetical protein [Microvirga makkahensis]